MKRIILTLLIILSVDMTIKANDQDTLWIRYTSPINELDFTPDDNYVVAWNNNIEFWEVEQGVKEFFIPTEAVGDYNYNEEFLVFSQDSTPKLLNWQTREVFEGFEKEDFRIDKIRTAKSKNEFIALGYQKEGISFFESESTVYFWDINSKLLVDSLEILNQFEKDNFTWRRAVLDYDYIGNNDEYLYVKFIDYNNRIIIIPPSERRTNYFYHLYNRSTKELVDSIFVFQDTKNGAEVPIDRIQVMNNRSRIAWNNKGGEINFYDINTRQFYDNFSRQDFSKVNDIELSRDDQLISLTYGKFINVFNVETENLVTSFNTGSTYGQCKLSNNDRYMIGSIDDILIMHPVTLSSVETNALKSQTTISPNPTSSIVNIDLICSESVVDYQITDINGEKIMQSTKANQNGNLQIDLSSYSAGVYFLTINCKEPMTYKIIKE